MGGTTQDPWLAQGWDRARSVMLVVAHPGDELFASALLLRADHLHLIYATEGVPRSRAYEKITRHALTKTHAALKIANVERSQVVGLDYPAEETSFHLVDLVWSIVELIAEKAPERLITHAYQGGDRDHDSCAFAASAACKLVQVHGGRAPVLFEFDRTPPDSTAELLSLSPSELSLRGRIAEAHGESECIPVNLPASDHYRLAPDYDFSLPPHLGPLAFEQRSDGISGARWRGNAFRALTALGLRRSPQAA